MSSAQISRRSLLSLLVVLGANAAYPITATASDVTGQPYSIPDGFTCIYSDDDMSLFQKDNQYLIVELMGTTLVTVDQDDCSLDISLPDGSLLYVTQDEMGCIYLNGALVGDILYLHDEGGPVAKGCVLLSSQKQTVEEASSQGSILLQLMSYLPGFAGALSTLASSIYDLIVALNSDLWLIIKTYYCDTPKPLTRKEVYVYADEACTQLLDKRVYEDDVPVYS